MMKGKGWQSVAMQAVGEVALVVIGILVAIEVNNWNEDRKAERRIGKILLEMQQELLGDVDEAASLMQWAEKQEEYAAKMIESKIDDAQYEDPTYRFLFSVGTETYPLIVTSVAFRKLSNFNGAIPARYDDLISEMNQLYIEERLYVEELFKRLNDYTVANHNRMYAEYGWMVDLENGDLTADVLDYFKNDTSHKSHLCRYKNLLHELSLENVGRLRARAIVLFYAIENVTKSEKIPVSVKPYAPLDDPRELAPYLGRFEDAGGTSVVDVDVEEGRLVVNKEVMFCASADAFEFAYFPGSSCVFRRGVGEEVDELSVTWDGKTYDYSRVVSAD